MKSGVVHRIKQDAIVFRLNGDYKRGAKFGSLIIGDVLLESVGYEVASSGDGADGIRLFSEKAFDLVITDIMMPGINGVQVVHKLKQKDLGVKIITISSGSAEEKSDLLRMSVILGAVKAIHKPIDRDKLLETVRDALKN
jgi:CheY-like chemotaxis protein